MTTFRNIILMVMPLFVTAIHPIHVSVSDVEWKKTDRELQIIVRIFTDDLEQEIRNETANQKLDILNPGEKTTSKALFENYLKKHLRIKVNGIQKEFNYLGFEEESGSVVSYLLINEVAEFNRIEVHNDILVEEFDDQVNLVHVTVNDDIHTMKFVKDQRSSSLTFK